MKLSISSKPLIGHQSSGRFDRTSKGRGAGQGDFVRQHVFSQLLTLLRDMERLDLLRVTTKPC
ncbi:MAG: hypothetical protein LBD96_06160 [Treponema sp.]|nr:hypothetical protein [Treponema sp.]